MEDNKIIELFFERNERGIKELSEKFSRLIGKISNGILSSREDAEECLNDTLLAVWNSVPPDKPDNLSAYVCKIARRKAINRLRYNKAPVRCSDLLTELDECIPSRESPVEDLAEIAELTEALNKWLETLKPKHKKLFIQRYFYALAIKDAASECSMSLTAATTALSRMRESLRKYLNERGFLDEN